jgi:hypothetical protein
VRVDALAPWGLLQSCRRVNGGMYHHMYTSTRLTSHRMELKGPEHRPTRVLKGTGLARQASILYAWCT